MFVLADTFTTKLSAIRIAASLPALSGKTFPKIGFAPYAVWEKTLLRKSNLFNAKMPTYGKNATYGKNTGSRSGNLIKTQKQRFFKPLLFFAGIKRRDGSGMTNSFDVATDFIVFFLRFMHFVSSLLLTFFL